MRTIRRGATTALLGLTVLCGCSAETYLDSAHREVYSILEAKQGEVVPRERPFRVDQEPLALAEVGRPGTVEDLRQTPPPQPVVQDVDLSDMEDLGDLESIELDDWRALLESRSSGASLPWLAEDTGEDTGSGGDEPTPGTEAGGPAAQGNAVEPDTGSGSDTDANPAPSTGTDSDTETDSDPDSESDTDADTAPATGTGTETGTDSDSNTGSETNTAEEIVLPTVPEVEIPGIPGRILDLDEVNRVALANNRSYQDQREQVYLTALALTLARYQFAPRFFGVVTGDWTRDGSDNTSGEITTDFGWNHLLASGARFSISALTNLFQFFSGEREEVARTVIGASLTQPLLRGFGSHIVQEPLTQSERDTIYALRSFERFRKTFAVDVMSEYYRVLLERTRVMNEYANWRDLVTNFERVRSMASAEQIPQFEVDQADQQVLQARNRWVDAVESYESAVDRLKITLGIPTDASIGFDRHDLDTLLDPGSETDIGDLETAIETALAMRLDLQTARDRVEDAERRVTVAADALRAQLDITVSASLPSGQDAQQPLKFDVKKGTYGVGFDLDLPFDRKAERNDYAEAVINLERRRRDLSLLEDNVRLTVRDAFRSLLREKESYEIQSLSVTLSRKRVESTTELLQAGRVETRDLLDSQAALIDALNNRITSLVNYTIARLEFHRDVGTLRIDDGGRHHIVSIGDATNE